MQEQSADWDRLIQEVKGRELEDRRARYRRSIEEGNFVFSVSLGELRERTGIGPELGGDVSRVDAGSMAHVQFHDAMIILGGAESSQHVEISVGTIRRSFPLSSLPALFRKRCQTLALEHLPTEYNDWVVFRADEPKDAVFIHAFKRAAVAFWGFDATHDVASASMIDIGPFTWRLSVHSSAGGVFDGLLSSRALWELYMGRGPMAFLSEELLQSVGVKALADHGIDVETEITPGWIRVAIPILVRAGITAAQERSQPDEGSEP